VSNPNLLYANPLVQARHVQSYLLVFDALVI
jgi:hypothetical protein